MYGFSGLGVEPSLSFACVKEFVTITVIPKGSLIDKDNFLALAGLHGGCMAK